MTMLRLGLTPQEAADLLGVSVRTIYRAMEREEIETDVISGRKIILARALVERFGEPIEVAA